MLFLCVACGCAPGPRPAATAERAADIDAITTAKVQTWRQLYREQDAAGLNDFLLDDFIVIGADGTLSTKTEEVAWLAGHAWSGPEDFVYVVEDIVFQGPDVAMVYGHGKATRLQEGKPACLETYRSSNLFRRSEGRWRPGFSHLSGVDCLSADEFEKRYPTIDPPG